MANTIESFAVRTSAMDCVPRRHATRRGDAHTRKSAPAFEATSATRSLTLEIGFVSSSSRTCFGMALAIVACLTPRVSWAKAGPRIAAAIERSADFTVPMQFGEGAAIRALAQGVREACLQPAPLGPRQAVVECAVLPDAPTSHVCLDETAERALTIEVKCGDRDVAAEAIDLSRAGCDTSACFAVEARRAGATHLLMVKGSWKDGLALTGTLMDLATGHSNTLTPWQFEKTYNAEWPRSGPQVLGLLKWFARETTLEVLVRQTTAAGAGEPRPGPVVLVSPSVPQAPTSTYLPRWVGWTLVGAGAAAGVGSWFLWNEDKDPSGCNPVAGDVDPCRRQHRTIVPAIALGVGAAGALLAGAIVLVRSQSGNERLGLTVHSSGVILGGTF
jgi:hypothetical protein